MIIPKEYGGLGFSAFAHSEVVRKISTRSLAAAVTVMVPNSLGPGELLMRFGTDEQQQHWLPRLADGRDIPCFALTSPEAGSDAASMTDSGIICRARIEGKRVLGIRLNWHKRYITLGPVATVLGLAFKALRSRPSARRSGRPRHHGRAGADQHAGRHDRPAALCRRCRCSRTGRTGARTCSCRWIRSSAAQERIGQGWKMLMSALAAGRGISLPSLSAPAPPICAHHRRLCPRPRAVQRADRQFEGVAGGARRASPPPPIGSTPRAA